MQKFQRNAPLSINESHQIFFSASISYILGPKVGFLPPTGSVDTETAVQKSERQCQSVWYSFYYLI